MLYLKADFLKSLISTQIFFNIFNETKNETNYIRIKEQNKGIFKIYNIRITQCCLYEIITEKLKLQ